MPYIANALYVQWHNVRFTTFNRFQLFECSIYEKILYPTIRDNIEFFHCNCKSKLNMKRETARETATCFYNQRSFVHVFLKTFHKLVEKIYNNSNECHHFNGVKAIVTAIKSN